MDSHLTNQPFPGLPHDIPPASHDTSQVGTPGSVNPAHADIEDEGVGVSQDQSAQRRAPPREIVLNFSTDQLKMPTMALVQKALTDKECTYDRDAGVGGFSASLPGDDKHPRLDTFIRTDSSGKPFTCFQGEMTFSIKATDKDGNKVTLKFTQIIETSVRVPIHGDNREVKDAMMKTLFKLEGYRQHIGEPLLKGVNEKIQDLATKKFLTIAVVREEESKTATFYNKNVRWEQYSLKQQLYTPMDCFKSSIKGVKVEGEKEHNVTTLWTKEPTCERITERDKALTKIVELAKGDHPSQATIQQLLTSGSQTTNSALTVIIRNTLDDMDDLHQNVISNKNEIESLMTASKAAQAEANSLGQQISALSSSEAPDTAQIEKLTTQKTLKETEAKTNKDKATSIQTELNKDLQNIQDSISAVKTLLNPEKFTLSTDTTEAKKITAAHTPNLKIMERTLEDFKLKETIGEIKQKFPMEISPQRASRPPGTVIPPPPTQSNAGQPLIELEEVTSARRPRAPDPVGVEGSRTWQSPAERTPELNQDPIQRSFRTSPRAPIPAPSIQPQSIASREQIQARKTELERNLQNICEAGFPDDLIELGNSVLEISNSSTTTLKKIEEIDWSLKIIAKQLENAAQTEKNTLRQLNEALSEYKTLLTAPQTQRVPSRNPPLATTQRTTEEPTQPIAEEPETLIRSPREQRQIKPLSAQEMAQVQNQPSVQSQEEINLLDVCATIPERDHPLSAMAKYALKAITSPGTAVDKTSKMDFVVNWFSGETLRQNQEGESPEVQAKNLETAQKFQKAATEYRALLESQLTTEQKDDLLWKPIAAICEAHKDLSNIVYQAMEDTDFNRSSSKAKIAILENALYTLNEYSPEEPSEEVETNKKNLILALTNYRDFWITTLPTKERDPLLWKPINDICDKPENTELSDIVITNELNNDISTEKKITLLNKAVADLDDYKRDNSSLEEGKLLDVNQLMEAVKKYVSFLSSLPEESPPPAAAAPAGAKSPERWEQKPTTPEARLGDMLYKRPTPRTQQPTRAEMATQEAATETEDKTRPPIAQTTLSTPATAPAKPIVLTPIEREPHLLATAKAIFHEFSMTETDDKYKLSVVIQGINDTIKEPTLEKKIEGMNQLLNTISELSIDASLEVKQKLEQLTSLATEHTKFLKSTLFQTTKTINEIITTEQEFQRRLGTAITLLTLIDEKTSPKNPTINKALKDYQALLTAITQNPIKFNNELGDNTPATIAEAYASDAFRLYLAFSEPCLTNRAELITVLTDVLKKDQKLKAACDNIIPLEAEAVNKLSIDSYIAVPFQRVMKHPSFIDGLQKNSMSDDLSPKFDTAIKKLVAAIGTMNIRTTERELETLINQIDKHNELYLRRGYLAIRERVKDSKINPEEIEKRNQEKIAGYVELERQLNAISQESPATSRHLFKLLEGKRTENP